jgi:lysophospholipid acyltransferase (LPLAT)-like uncharacterized protein
MLRVDTRNPILRLGIHIYGWILGILIFVILAIWRKTLQIEGKSAVEKLIRGRYILAFWHEDLILYFLVFQNAKNQVWMNHPAWFMKPVHVLLYLNGVEFLVLGSSGNSGKEALQRVVEAVKAGSNSVVAVDGPAGPPKVMKPGALIMACEGNVPYYALNFKLTKFKRLGGWDKKRIPLPFSKVEINIGEKELMNNNFEITLDRLQKGLDSN